MTTDVVARTFSLAKGPVVEAPKSVTEEEMTTMFGAKAPTSEYCLSQMADPVRRAGIRFINEMINLKHAASYISKGLMSLVLEAEGAKPVDWTELLMKNLDKELRNVDV